MPPTLKRLVAVGSNVAIIALITGTNLATYTTCAVKRSCMITSHRIALDPTNKQRTLLRQHAEL